MAPDVERLAIPPGHKFYHATYDLHSCHILQLVTDLHCELIEFRKRWEGEGHKEIFIDNIVGNLEFLWRENRNASEDQTNTDPILASSGGKGKGKAKASDPSEERNVRRDDPNRTRGAVSSNTMLPSSSRAYPPVQAPCILTLRRDGVCKPLTIRLPPIRRPESAEINGEDSSSTSTIPPVTRASHAVKMNSRTEPQKRLKPDPEVKEEPRLDDTGVLLEGRWERQVFQRNYTVVGPITSNTPRYQPPPNHPPVYTTRPYVINPLPGPSRAKPEVRILDERGRRRVQKQKEQDSNIGRVHRYPTRSSRRRSSSRRRKDSQNETGAAGNQKDSTDGAKKRRREGDEEEVKEEAPKPRKRTRRN